MPYLATEEQKRHILSGFLYIAEEMAYDMDSDLPERTIHSSPEAKEKAKILINSFLSMARKPDIEHYLITVPWNSDSRSGLWVNLGNDLAHEFIGTGVSFTDRAELRDSVAKHLSSIASDLQDGTQPVAGDNGLMYFE